MPIKIQSENVLKNFKEGFIGVNGANKKLKQALIGINGVNKELWKSEIPPILVWSLATGTEGKPMMFDTSKRLYITYGSVHSKVVRYDSSMSADWTYTGMTGLRSTYMDASNNIYAHGNPGSSQIWKINSSGTKIWAHTPTSVGSSNPKPLIGDSNGNSYIAWTSSSGDPYLYKTTSSGTKGWEVPLGTGHVYAVGCDGVGNPYVTINNAATNRLIKLNTSNGSILWTYDLPIIGMDLYFNPNNNDIYCVGLDGKVYVISTTGSLKKVITIAPNEAFSRIILASDGSMYIATNEFPKIIKTDSEGNIIFTLITGLTGYTRGFNLIDDYIYISVSTYTAGVVNYMKFKELAQ